MKTLELAYDEEGDVLYVTFQRTKKGHYQSLNDHMVVRFDPRLGEAVGLTLIDFSAMLPRADGTTPQLVLDRLDELPPDRRELVLSSLLRPPLSYWLEISSSTATPVSASISHPHAILDLLRAA